MSVDNYDTFADIAKYRLQTNRTGGIKASAYNINQILSNHEDFKGFIRFNTFSMRVIKQSGFMFGEGEWQDNDLTATLIWLSEHYSMEASDRLVQNIVTYIASKNSYSSVRDYLFGLQWDGTPRVKSFLVKYFGVEDSYSVNVFNRAFLLGAVARVVDPGCKNDNVLILEGKTGIKKSSGLKELCGEDWFSDAPLDLGNTADCYLGMRGNWFIEMAELKKFKGASATALRAFFSQSTDQYREPYGRNMVTVPRQCIFVGTTNDDVYFNATTNRRYMPVTATKVDFEGIIADRNQIWAEALQEYLNAKATKTPWWFEPDDTDIISTQNERLDLDPWHDEIERFVTGRDKVHNDEIYAELDLELSRITKGQQNRIYDIMSILGWKKGRPYVRGAQRRGFLKKTNDEFR